MQEKWIPIGKMAEINHISIATLRLYDEIDLLKPAYIDPESKYRYYTIEQNARLDLIAYMKDLGMSLKEIQKGISNIKVISHRLELKTSENITIIDDSYNSNPVGSQNAIEVLKLMKGKKVIITPGMVEMGKDEEKLNYEFGRKMANVCDRFYLIGKKRSKPIEKGIIDENKKADIKVFNSFNEAYNDFRKDNDLRQNEFRNNNYRYKF